MGGPGMAGAWRGKDDEVKRLASAKRLDHR